MLTPNTILRERYRIIQQLGHGGMGAVYQAMDENLSCLVAVKETFAVTDEQRRAFRREAQLLANLNHPTLPRVMDHFTHDEGQFLVMQFVPGHDLEELLGLRERRPFSVSKVLEWADQLLDALEELHSFDPPIVHRDIKPANLKLTPKGKILLLDFGLAKGIAGQMSIAEVDSPVKSIYGYTPNYAPLEQMRGAGTDPRTDLYSLAATLRTLFTGQVPPDALSRVAEKENGNSDPLCPAYEVNPDVPVSISEVLQRAMSLAPGQRQPTAADLRNALRDATQVGFEPATLPLSRANSLEPTALPPMPPSEPTLKAPDPASYGAPLGVHYIPTMRGSPPPTVASQEREARPPSGAPSSKTSLGLESNVGAMLCYTANFLCFLGLVLAVVLLITEKEHRFVRFHALQALFLAAAQIAVGIIVGILGLILSLVLNMIHMEFLGWILIMGFRFILFFVFVILWIIAGVKAYGGQWYKLPIIGEFAWKSINN